MPSFLFSRASALASLILGLIISALLLGKLLWFPVALIGPSNSFPAFVGVASYVLLTGNKTFYCWDPLRTACQLSENTTSENPTYSVILEIPTILWALSVILATALLTHATLTLAPRGFKILTTVTSIALVINAVAVGSLYIDQSPLTYPIPEIKLNSVRINLEEGLFIVELGLENLEIRSASCSVDGFGQLETRVVQNTVKVRLPEEYFEWLYSVRSAERPYVPPTPPASIYEFVRTSCSIDLDIGRLEGRYVASFMWREPDIEVSGSKVFVINRNRVPLEVMVTIIDKNRLTIVERSLKTIEPLGVLLVEVPGPGVYDVRINYVFLGVERARGVEVFAG
ncbi:MAG: hypothetical protein QXV55_04215 [Acidilobaceae archaeon]